MKKDYIPITSENTARTEADFIEQHWTKIWQNSQVGHAQRQVERQEEFQRLKPALTKLSRQSRILDGGCGLGEWTHYLAAKGFEVVGLDISKATIEMLQKAYPECHFMVGDIRQTGFEQDWFDLYFSWGTFEHFESGLGDPLREAWRILKPGGLLIISVPFYNLRHLRKENRQHPPTPQPADPDPKPQANLRFYQWRLTEAELQREFELNGFQALKIEPIAKRHGLYRAVRHELRLNPDSIAGKVVRTLLYPFIPSRYVAHMLIGVAQKVVDE